MPATTHHRVEHDVLLHLENLLVQAHHARDLLLHLVEHDGAVVLFRVVLEHHHAVLLVDRREDLAGFDLIAERKRHH